MADEHQAGDMGLNLGVVAERSGGEMGVAGDRAGEQSDILARLRTPEARENVLRSMMDVMMPEDVDPTIWERWLNGDARPSKRNELEHPGGQSSQRELGRKSRSVAKAKTGVHNAQRAVDAAQKAMNEAELKLAEVRSEDAARIQYAVSKHLEAIMAPMFAMGPAWTVMRAISAYASPEMLKDELSLIRDSRRRADREQAIRRERQEGTAHILDALDRWGGDVDFEYELREAIEKVCDSYAKRGWPARQSRAVAEMRTTLPDPDLSRDRDEIVEGMRSTGNRH